MKQFSLFLFGIIGSTLLAGPTVSDVIVSKKADKSLLRVRYQLDEPAVVTIDVKVRGVSIGESALTNMTGDVNALVKAGRRYGGSYPEATVWTAGDRAAYDYHQAKRLKLAEREIEELKCSGQ